MVGRVGGFGGGRGGFGGRGGGRGGGGRRSDLLLKHDIALIGHLDNGLGFYRFSYNGSDKVYVGVTAQEVQAVMPEAVERGSDGYLKVFYDMLGLKLQTYDQWIASGAEVPTGAPVKHRTLGWNAALKAFSCQAYRNSISVLPGTTGQYTSYGSVFTGSHGHQIGR